MTPSISIIIPCYNQGGYIKEALQSIELCTDKNLYEVIIVNDGSTGEETLKVLKELENDGYNILNQPNLGLAKARNNGIKAGKGKYILPLDSDNKIRPGYIYESIAIMDNDDKVDVVYGDAEYFGERSGILKSQEFNLQQLMLYNYIDACAVFRKSMWEEIGGYDENMPAMGWEDWDLWLRIAFNGGKFRYLNKVMFDYRYINDSMIRSLNAEKVKGINEYMNEKYKCYLNKNYLNKAIYSNISNQKKLIIHIILKTIFPGLYRLLIKTGLIHDNDLI